MKGTSKNRYVVTTIGQMMRYILRIRWSYGRHRRMHLIVAIKRETSSVGHYHEPSPPARRSVRLKLARLAPFFSISDQHFHKERWTFNENAQLPFHRCSVATA